MYSLVSRIFELRIFNDADKQHSNMYSDVPNKLGVGGSKIKNELCIPRPPSLFGASCLSASLNIHNSNIRETRLYMKFPATNWMSGENL